MRVEEWRDWLFRGGADEDLAVLYGSPLAQRDRYLRLLDQYVRRFGPGEAVFCSAPGRTELCGNHTDHQRGRVLCGSVTMDTLAVASPAEDNIVTVVSEGFGEISLRLDDLAPRKEEEGTSAAILRGVAAGLRARGNAVGGFRAVCVSNVPAGGGLSSSASFEILAGALLTRLYGGNAGPMELAKIGQRAERAYFGKPSGLLDQAACASGGISMIDFRDPEDPAAEPIAFEYRAHGFVLCAVDTHTSHAGLTADYAAIPADMFRAAEALGQRDLRAVDRPDPVRMAALPPRARRRAEHFFAEEDRVLRMAEALRQGDMPSVIRVMNESGASSRERLENVIPPSHPGQTAMAQALDRAEALLRDRGGWRIHGGGFAGCIQCLVPADMFPAFQRTMDGFYGGGSCFELRIRPVGVHFLGESVREDDHA